MHSDYHIPAMRELRDQQVRFAPRDKKLEQLDRAEKLIAEIDPERTYTYAYLCFRITAFRPEVSPDVAMSGAEALQDLLLFVEDVSDAANVPVEEVQEPVLHGRAVEQELQRVDQDDLAVAPAGAGQSQVRVSGSQAGRVSQQQRAAVCVEQSRADSARRPVQPADGIGADGDHRSGAAAGAGRRRAGGSHAADCQAHESQCGDDSLHAQAVRPEVSRRWRSSRTTRVR